MSWFGKAVGGTIGMMVGGPLGAMAGAAIGHHMFDKKGGAAAVRRFGVADGDRFSGGAAQYRPQRERVPDVDPTERRQATYFVALFSLLGKLAKADGRITREEGDAVVTFLDRLKIAGDERTFAIRIFNEAKNSGFTVEQLAGQFADATASDPQLRSSMIDMLFQIAIADQELHPGEEQMIATIARRFGIGDIELGAIKARYLGNMEHAYAVLGLSPDVGDQELKDTYRRLVQEYHPDKIIGQGMPQEFVDYANQRFQEIQNAWDAIKRKRGL